MMRGLNVNRKSFDESDPVHVPGQRASPDPARYRTSATDYRQAEPGPKLGALVEVSALADTFLPIPAARTAREEHWPCHPAAAAVEGDTAGAAAALGASRGAGPACRTARYRHERVLAQHVLRCAAQQYVRALQEDKAGPALQGR